MLAQTYSNFEVILVDDGSPDNCPQICDEYARNDERIRVIHKKNGGSVSARKSGLSIAKGDYICFVDGDDFISNDMLEKYEEILSEQNIDIICIGYYEYFSPQKIVKKSQQIPNGIYTKNDLQEKVYPKMLSTKPFYNFFVSPTVWSKCIKTTVAIDASKNVPDNLSLGDDVAVVYSALLKSSCIRVIDYCGYMYRKNPTSMTHSYDSRLYDKIKSLAHYLKEVEKEEHWESNTQIDEYILFVMFTAKNNEFKYNTQETCCKKIQNIKRYLKEPIIKTAIKNVRVDGIKNKVIQLCFKWKILIPLYFYENMSKRKNNDEQSN